MILIVSCVIIFSLIFSANANAEGAKVGLTYVYGLNGNQEILGDPSRQIIYYADRNAGDLILWNYSSNAKMNLSIGAQPICVDLGVNDTLLYVALATDRSIAVVDVNAFVVDHYISLNFTPASLAARSANELYISSANDTLVRLVNLTSDAVSISFDAGYTAILNANTKGDDLLATAIWKPDGHVNITRYSLTPTPHAIVSTDLGLGVTAQVAVDWDNGAFYLAANGLGGFQKRSLSDLHLMASFNNWRDTNGIALSRDAKTVYAVCTSSYWDLPGGQQIDRWGSMIYILAANDFTLEGMKFISGERGAITASNDPNSVFIGSPLEKVGVELNIQPGLPAPGSIYGYTPSYVEFNFAGDVLPAFRPEYVKVYLDGGLLSVSQTPSSSYRAMITSAFADGGHSVEVNINDSIYGGWNFTIDSTSPYAILPALNLTSPAANSYVSEIPGSVSVTYQFSAPEPLSSGISLFFNGIPMIEYTDEWHPGTVYGYVPYVPSMSYGIYTVNANMSWLGGSHNYSWSFTWQQFQFLSPMYPSPGSILPTSPTSVSAELFLGRPAAVINSTEVRIDGVLYPYFVGTFDESNAFVGANLSTPLQPGSHRVHINVSTSLGGLETDWQFSIDALALRQYKQDFSIMLPESWNYSKDIDVGGSNFNLSATGPVLYDVTTNLLVQSGINWSMVENSSLLLSLPDSVINGLHAAGIRCGLMEGPTIVEISGHMAVQYSIQWFDLSIVQRQVIIVNQESHRHWIMTFTVHQGQYFWMRSSFDAMEYSFSLLPGANQTKMTNYDYWGTFTIPVPDTWTTKENQTIGGQLVNLAVEGPVLDGYLVDFAVGSEKNDTVRGDRSSLESQVQEGILSLADKGVYVTLRGDENYTTVSGLPAMIFTLDWTGQPIIEKSIILVDEGSHTRWVVTCGSSRASFDLLEPTFDTIVTGIVITPTIIQPLSPGIPTGLHSVAGNGKITLNWTAPSYEGPGVLTYHLFRDNALIWSGAEIAHNDTGLTNGRNYSYKVSASNDVGWGLNSTLIMISPMAPLVPPGQPTGLKAVVGDGQVTLNWTAPINVGSSEIFGYEVYWGTNASSFVPSGTVFGINCTLTGMTNGHTYYFKVAAVSGAGMGNFSEIIAVTPTASNNNGAIAIVGGVAVIVIVAVVGSLLYLRRKK